MKCVQCIHVSILHKLPNRNFLGTEDNLQLYLRLRIIEICWFLRLAEAFVETPFKKMFYTKFSKIFKLAHGVSPLVENFKILSIHWVNLSLPSLRDYIHFSSILCSFSTGWKTYGSQLTASFSCVGWAEKLSARNLFLFGSLLTFNFSSFSADINMKRKKNEDASHEVSNKVAISRSPNEVGRRVSVSTEIPSSQQNRMYYQRL